MYYKYIKNINYYETNIIYFGFLIVLTLFIYIIYRKIIYLTWHYSFQENNKYIPGEHQWRAINLTGPRYCNLCETIVYGIQSYVLYCDICDMYAHATCATKQKKIIKLKLSKKYKSNFSINNNINNSNNSNNNNNILNKKCKIIGIDSFDSTTNNKDNNNNTISHHWVKGNNDSGDTCNICGLFCGSITSGMKCSWCHIHVHNQCFSSNTISIIKYIHSNCSLGIHSSLVLPPYYVHLHPTKSFRIVINDKNNNYNDRTPLLVFINKQSGGQFGLTVLRKLRTWLNPLQIYDLNDNITNIKNNRINNKDITINPTEILKKFQNIPGLRILVCGGDGTVAWILSAIDQINNNIDNPNDLFQPPVAILPLGTGNDLARVLGWAGGYSLTDMSGLLYEIEDAHMTLLDRWRVEINSNLDDSNIKQKNNDVIVMNNYFGIGVDAQVALEFHKTRKQSHSLLFSSSFINKLWYSRFGAKNVLIRKCMDLSSFILLECDGRKIKIPENAEGIIVLNINSYGGGSTLWKAKDDQYDSLQRFFSSDDEYEDLDKLDNMNTNVYNSKSSHQDGLLDVVAVYGAFHLGQLQVGLSEAIHLCQCKDIKITLSKNYPIQIDGEPISTNESYDKNKNINKIPTIININYYKKNFMLKRTVKEKDVINLKIEKILNVSESKKIINTNQKNYLLTEIKKSIDNNNVYRHHHRNRKKLLYYENENNNQKENINNISYNNLNSIQEGKKSFYNDFTNSKSTPSLHTLEKVKFH